MSRSPEATGARTPRRPARTHGHLGRGALAALLTHVHLLAPFVIATFVYAAREEAQRAEEVDVGFEDVPAEELPQDLPPLDDTPEPLATVPPDREKPDRQQPDKKTEAKKRDEEVRKPEEKQAEQKPPEPEIVVPPLPPMPPQPPPPQPKSHEKIVDLDNDKDVEPPPDAKYLAQKNNRAEVETRDTQTNLERNQKGDQGGQQNPENERQDDDQAGDDKAKVAELEDLKSKLGREAPDITPSKETEAPQPRQADSAKPPSPVLSLRDASPRGHEITPETVDPSLPHDPAGMMARAKPRGAFRDSETREPDRGKRLKLSLSGKDYEYLFGAEAKAERQLAQRERSTQLGKRGQRLARIRSSLENFISEVKPGNQTALNTRAAPFAAFIARMHRNIHKLWGYGALEDWDDLPPNSPFNDDTLATVVEIVLNRDGTVDKVSIVRPSRYLAYDAAAIDTVYSAGPYPEPPREIRSKNGKIYVHWSFFRDARQCATTGVDYFILNNAPQGGDAGDGEDEAQAPAAAPPSGAAAEGPRRLERNLAEAPQRSAAGTKWWGKSTTTAKPHVHSEDEEAESAAASAPPEPSRPDDSGAAAAARAWLAAFGRGDVQAMTQGARYPFRSSSGVIANGPEELGRMLRSLVAESAHRGGDNVKVETAAGLRKLLGKLPPGLDDGSGMLFATTEVDGDTLILPLAKTSHGWKVAGLVRR